MSQDDPFATPSGDRTIIMPSPRGRAAQTPPPAPQPAGLATALPDDGPAALAGLNPLLAIANPLLDIVPQLRATPVHNDPAGLRDFLAQGIREFESRGRALNLPQEVMIGARYCLCTLLDETAASTPWGGSGVWAGHSLLSMFHNETWGGEKFFLLLAKLAENPRANRDLLELMYACLALGFEGRYRVLDNGASQLDALRHRLADILRKERGEYERDLSAQWLPAQMKRSRVLMHLPLWVAAVVAVAVLFLAYLGLSIRLNHASDPLFAQIQAIRAKAPPPVVVAPPPAPSPRLAAFLAEEVRQGLVSVREDANASVVTIRGDGLFAPGNATIEANYLPLLGRIAAALNGVAGRVQVTGHTDNRPIRSARFPSNWHLSQERARNVMQILQDGLKTPSRISAEGRADAEPIAANDTPEGRSRNRRVEITLYATKVAP